MLYTNLSPHATWPGTIAQVEPWGAQVPALASLQVQGFDHRVMLSPDFLHCWCLGHCRLLLGSAIASLVSSGSFRRLSDAWLDLKAFCTAHNLRLRNVRCFTRTSLKWHARSYPETPGKGADANVMLKWLADLVGRIPHVDPLLATSIWAADWFVNAILNGPAFFRRPNLVGFLKPACCICKRTSSLRAVQLLQRIASSESSQSFTCAATWFCRWGKPQEHALQGETLT